MHQIITEIYFLLDSMWKYHSNTLHHIVYPGVSFSNYEYITQPNVTVEDRMIHAIHFLSVLLKDVLKRICDYQLASIEAAFAHHTQDRELTAM